jgi:hypothetical protein
MDDCSKRGSATGDPSHYDGGPSILQLCLTVAGNRRLIVDHASGTASVPLETGSIYVTAPSCFKHFVDHAQSSSLLRIEGRGLQEVVVMFRSHIFKANYATRSKNIPMPEVLHRAMARVIACSMSRRPIVLPSYDVFLEEFEKLCKFQSV